MGFIGNVSPFFFPFLSFLTWGFCLRRHWVTGEIIIEGFQLFTLQKVPRLCPLQRTKFPDFANTQETPFLLRKPVHPTIHLDSRDPREMPPEEKPPSPVPSPPPAMTALVLFLLDPTFRGSPWGFERTMHDDEAPSPP